MITIAALLLTALVLIAVGVLFLAIFGGGFILVYGDIIVGVTLVAIVIRKLINRKTKK